jgi:hypothetical protein
MVPRDITGWIYLSLMKETSFIYKLSHEPEASFCHDFTFCLAKGPRMNDIDPCHDPRYLECGHVVWWCNWSHGLPKSAQIYRLECLHLKHCPNAKSLPDCAIFF